MTDYFFLVFFLLPIWFLLPVLSAVCGGCIGHFGNGTARQHRQHQPHPLQIRTRRSSYEAIATVDKLSHSVFLPFDIFLIGCFISIGGKGFLIAFSNLNEDDVRWLC